MPFKLNKLWLLVLMSAVAACLSLPFFGWLKEDVQTILFPICLLAFWRIPKNPALRIPGGLVLAAFAGWLVATAHMAGLFPSLFSGGNAHASVMMGRLIGDDEGVLSYAMHKRHSEIARIYSLAGMELIQRSFADEAAARDWLQNNHPRSAFIVTGTKEWGSVVINREVTPAIVGSIIPETERLPLDSAAPANVLPIKFWWSDQTFYLRVVPESIALPFNSGDLTLHYLAWLAQSLQIFPAPSDSGKITELQSAEALARRFDSASNLLAFDGNWGSGSLPGFANYLLATWEFLEAYSQRGEETLLMERSLKKFQSASTYVVRQHDPKLFVDVFNNAGVVLLGAAETREELYKARGWLMLAYSTLDKKGNSPEGARAAQLNLVALDRFLSPFGKQ